MVGSGIQESRAFILKRKRKGGGRGVEGEGEWRGKSSGGGRCGGGDLFHVKACWWLLLALR